MSQNLVSLSLTNDQIAAALAAVEQIEASLPGLIALQPDDRKGLVFMGPRSEAFCRQTVRVLDQNRRIVPPSLDLDGALADLAAVDQLRPVLERLQRLIARVDDTVNALGSDLMVTSLEGYSQLKLSGAAHGLDELRKEIGGRFARPRRSKTSEAEMA